MKARSIAGLAIALTLALGACSSGGTPTASTSATGATSAAASDPAVAALNGTLRVGTEGTYSPFTFHDPSTNELTGYDIEVITAVAEKLGVTAEFSETKWDAIFAGLEAKRYDVIANQVSVNADREAKYDLSDAYTVSYPVVLVKADNTDITSLADVQGRTAAQTATSNWGSFATEAGATLEPVEGFTEAVAAVKDGRVDLTFNDNLAALEFLKSTGSTDIKVGFEVPEEKVLQAFALRKDSGLLPAINEAIDELSQDGTLASIGEKWFGQDVSE